MNPSSRLVALLALLGTSCVSAGPIDVLYSEPAKHVGQVASVEGYLKFGFENRNLYPSANWEADWRSGNCLPLGIRTADSTLLENAERLDGQRVIVTGEVREILSEGVISNSFCKRVGMMVTHIEPARPG
ncbi:MAG: hypothetical protein J7483_11330 [Novosphingobium sp.]|nr:hypothetical protein [Novosphingobium sp.]